MKIQCVVLRVDGKFYLETYSSIAQSVEHAAVNRAVVGSSPTRGVWVHGDQIIRPHGQAVKTSPFHGGNTSSNLVGVILLKQDCFNA